MELLFEKDPVRADVGGLFVGMGVEDDFFFAKVDVGRCFCHDAALHDEGEAVILL